MNEYQAFQVLSEGMIFGIVALGIYVAFVWLRFPDLTPDGSFVLGAGVFAVSVQRGVPALVAMLACFCAGAFAGSCTTLLNRAVRIPAVVAGLLVASGLYSVTWLVLQRPNRFIEPRYTLAGDTPGAVGAMHMATWALVIASAAGFLITILSKSIWGLRMRAIGENRLLSRDLGLSETNYTLLGLALANGLVGVGGGLFAQRSFSADINMGIGITIAGLAGLLLGLVFAGNHRRSSITVILILAGALVYKLVFFASLEFGIPPEAFRLISSSVLVVVFLAVSRAAMEVLRGLKWS